MNKRFMKYGYFFGTAGCLAIAVVLTGALLNHRPSPGKIKSTNETIANKADGRVTINGKEAASTGTLTAHPGQNVVYTSSTITPKAGANAGILTWDQSGNDGVTIEVRTKNSSHANWTKWTTLEAGNFEKDGGPRRGTASALILAKHISQYEFRFILKGNEERPSSTVDLSRSSYTTLNSTDGPTEKNGSANLAIAKPVGPNIIERWQWGCPEADNPEWPPEYADLKRAVIHHTASTESTDSYSDMRAIWQYHAKHNGWGDIGYNFIVDSKGRIFRGRGSNIDYARAHHKMVIGGHAYGANVGSVGISSIGNFDQSAPTEDQVWAIAEITGYAMSDSTDEPNGSQPSGQNIVGHYQVGSTSCPGAHMKSRLDQIRNIAQNVYNIYRPYTFRPLGEFHYMRIKNDTTKMMTENGAVITTSALKKGRDIKMADYISRNNTIYYRTVFDAENNNDFGIKELDIARIPTVPLPSPAMMVLTTSAAKTNPYTDQRAQSFDKDTVVKVVASVTINQVVYYQTSWDSSQGTSLFLPASALKPYGKYESFTEPRYLHIATDTAKINTDTMQPDTSRIAPGDYKFTTKIVTIDGVFYRTDADTSAGVPLAVPASAVAAIPYQKLPTTYHWQQIITPSAKFYPAAETASTSTFNTDMAPVKFVDQITINGKTYLRSEYDAARGNNLALPQTSLGDVAYTPLVEPRQMKLTRDFTPVNPLTGATDLLSLPKGHGARYETKIQINGSWYLRSNEATTQGSPYAIPLDYLSNF